MSIFSKGKVGISGGVALFLVVAVAAVMLTGRAAKTPVQSVQEPAQAAQDVAAAAGSTEVPANAPRVAATDASWTVRCNEQPVDGESLRGNCEVFQRLIIQETGQRMVEFAIGFPKDKPMARGVVVLPLGVDLIAGATLKIDEGQPFKFSVRYCTAEGCFAFLDMNDQLLSLLRDGQKLVITFQAAGGQNMSLPLGMTGFAEGLSRVIGS